MQELPHAGRTVLARTSALFDKDIYSDVQLVLKECIFYAHKLILSMSSPYFAERFNDKQSSEQDKIFPITDADAITFEKLLKYIYTDKFDFNDGIHNVRELCLLAKRFCVISLVEQCQQHISKNSVKPSLACKMYQMVLDSEEDMSNITESCMFTFAEKTTEVFKSDSFLQANLNVVQTILEMDTLNIDSEMDIFLAALEWGKFQQQNGKLSLRDNVVPLLKHIRFLTLSMDDFKKCVEYDILSGGDILAITLKLTQPNNETELSANLCSISVPRKKPYIFDEDDDGYNNIIPSYDPHIQDNKQSDIIDASKEIELNSEVIKTASLENLPNSTDLIDQSVDQILTEMARSSGKKSNFSDNISRVEIELSNKDNADVVFKPFEHFWKSQNNEFKEPYATSRNSPNLRFNESSLLQTEQNEIHDSEAKLKYVGCNNSLSEPKSVISDESDESDDEVQIKNQCKAVVLDLVPNTIKFAAHTTDVNSCIQLNVLKGTMTIIGLTFHLKETALQATQNVYVKLKGEDFSLEQIKKKVISGQFDFLFDEPLMISSGKNILITAIIDDLQLRSCFTCAKDQFIGRDDENNKYDVKIYGNQSFKNELPCLIRKILYN